MAVTWNVTCIHSQFLASKTATCCVSLSSFYNNTIVPCTTCSCGCQSNMSQSGNCVEWVISTRTLSHFLVLFIQRSCIFLVHLFCYVFFLSLICRSNSPYLASVVSGSSNNNNSLTPLVQCTKHMCPVRVHWHVKLNYKEYWRVKVTVTNFNYRMNYSEWNLVAQHPNFDNLTQLFSFNYKPLTPYGSISKCHA